MNDQTDKRPNPAYSTYKTLMTFVDGLAPHMPTVVDRSIMNTMSGSSQAATLSSLRFLKLVNHKHEPTDLLRTLAGSTGEKRKQAVREMLEGAYTLMDDVDLKSATPNQVEQWFRDQGVKGATVQRALAFFIAAAEEADIELSKHVTDRAKRRPAAAKASSNSGRSAKKKTKKVGAQRRPPAGEIVTPKGSTKYDIPLPPKPMASIILPDDLTDEDWMMLKQIIELYAQRVIATAAASRAAAEVGEEDEEDQLV